MNVRVWPPTLSVSAWRISHIDRTRSAPNTIRDGADLKNAFDAFKSLQMNVRLQRRLTFAEALRQSVPTGVLDVIYSYDLVISNC